MKKHFCIIFICINILNPYITYGNQRLQQITSLLTPQVQQNICNSIATWWGNEFKNYLFYPNNLWKGSKACGEASAITHLFLARHNIKTDIIRITDTVRPHTDHCIILANSKTIIDPTAAQCDISLSDPILPFMIKETKNIETYLKETNYNATPWWLCHNEGEYTKESLLKKLPNNDFLNLSNNGKLFVSHKIENKLITLLETPNPGNNFSNFKEELNEILQ